MTSLRSVEAITSHRFPVISTILRTSLRASSSRRSSISTRAIVPPSKPSINRISMAMSRVNALPAPIIEIFVIALLLAPYFMPVMVRPFMNCFWKIRNTIITGNVIRTAADMTTL